MRAFREKKLVSAKGLTLPFSEFKLFSDLNDPSMNKEKCERIVKNAEKLLEKEIPLLPASVYREYVVNGNRSNYESLFFLRRDMAVSFAVAEAYENKGRFTEKLMDVVWAIMEESTWLLPAHLYCSPHYSDASLGPVFGDNSLHGLALFAATTCGTLATVYLLCKDKLDAIEPVIARKMELLPLLTGNSYEVLKRSLELADCEIYDFDDSFKLLLNWCQEVMRLL